MDVSPYRRAYFALAKSLGLTDDMRHEFNSRLTSKASSTAWSVDDWRLAVAELQRLNGQQVRPGQPHIRGRNGPRSDAPASTAGPQSNSITAAQREFIAGLAAQIKWRTAPEAFIRARLLHPFRKSAWDGKLETLTRREAESAITAFKRLANWQSQARTARRAKETGAAR